MPRFVMTRLFFAAALISTPILMGANGNGCASESGSETEAAGGNGTGSPRCETVCESFSTSGCTNEPSYDGCMRTCLVLTSASSCGPTADDYFSCTENVAAACSSAGDPYFPGCGDEWLYAMECAVTSNPNPAMEQPCNDYCDNIQAASCEYSSPRDYCYTNCQWYGATGAGCDDEWGDYLACVDGVGMQCALGVAYAPGCGPQWGDYWACVDAVGE